MKKCLDCMNFKTQLIPKEKLKDMYKTLNATFIDKRTVRMIEDNIYNFGSVRIWKCSKGQLPHSFYTEKSYVEQLSKEDCRVSEF